MNRILITGATGFLGKHLVEQLRAHKEESLLRLFSRGSTPWDNDPFVEVAHGDISCADDVKRAAEGVSKIYHLAGIVSRDPKDAALLYRTHIEGTRNVCEAARRLGAGKIVIVSSSGTIAVSHEPLAHREDSGYKNEIVSEWPYYLSKIFAEKLALDYQYRYSLPLVVVNPSLLLGPGDDKQSSTGDVALFLKGQILAIPRGGLNFVDVRDAACGLIAASHAGKPGERYLLGGANWTFQQMIETVARIARRHAPRLKPSLGISLLSASLLRKLFPLLGKSFELDDPSIKMADLYWYCDSSKARQELGFVTRDPVETLKDTIQDIRQRMETPAS
ncbi:MAG TPA: NAD-dependent epimerase/dehydratase family protein [Terriglobia bacterium]|nr:NAD-dependent epimerase/dehydratase family protein [Terriglobia bacterium]